jgi:hypothetical protein
MTDPKVAMGLGKRLMKQATNQVTAAKGMSIRWTFAEKGAADYMTALLKDTPLEGSIEIVHKAMKW